MLCKWQGRLIRWLCGGVLYGLLEVLWRGHTHWTMMVLAAVLCVPLDLANEYFPWTLPLWVQAVLGGLAITAGELVAGLVLNVWLGLGIWDYSGLWGNLWGADLSAVRGSVVPAGRTGDRGLRLAGLLAVRRGEARV